MRLNQCIPMINPGLAPWAMQEYRPKGLLYVFPINILYYFDTGALDKRDEKALNKFRKKMRVKEPHDRGTLVQAFAYRERSLEEEQTKKTANKHR